MRAGLIAIMSIMAVSTTAFAADPKDPKLAKSAKPPDPIWSERVFAKPLDPDAPVSMRAFSTLAKELSPAVVNISVTKKAAHMQVPFFGPTPTGGLGTGFIIHADGYVLTNEHVVDEADEIQVKLANDHEYTARVVGSYKPLDVALIKFEPNEALTVAPLGSSDKLEIGEWVIAIGNPFGLSHTVTAGIVSAKGRRDIVPGGDATYAGFIQTDASINPGNSGGPLINIRGEVVGINTAINPAGQGIGFAVPIDMAKTVLSQLAAGKVNRSYLGVRVAEVPRELAEKLGDHDGHPTGALVKEVVEKSPASKAGIAAGDVIEKWNTLVLEDWHDLPWFASTATTGEKVALLVNRNGKELALNVTLAPYPEDATAELQPEVPSGGEAPAVGLTVAALPPEMRASSGLSSGEGVVVKDVQSGSVAEALGIKAGDIITQINYEAIKGGPDGFARQLAKIERGDVLAFTLRRGDRFMFKAFTR